MSDRVSSLEDPLSSAHTYEHGKQGMRDIEVRKTCHRRLCTRHGVSSTGGIITINLQSPCRCAIDTNILLCDDGIKYNMFTHLCFRVLQPRNAVSDYQYQEAMHMHLLTRQ